MNREVRKSNVELQPDTFPNNDGDMIFGAGLDDSMDEEEQEGDEDMYPPFPNSGQHNFTTEFHFDDDLDIDNLAPGPFDNSQASFGQFLSSNDGQDNMSPQNLFEQNGPPSPRPSDVANLTSHPNHPPKSTDLMDLFVTDESGEDQNIKCNTTSEKYLEEGEPGDYAMFELLRILDSHRCPRSLTSEIINWCKYASYQGCSDLASLPKDRNRFVKKIEKAMGKKGVRIPAYKVTWVQLEATEE